jgi:SEC-C motif domain protein
MSLCPCGTEKMYQVCCEPYITHQKIPASPEALMRSRYTAYTLADVAYIKQTMQGHALFGFDEASAARWAKRVAWLDLHVINTPTPSDITGHVEFRARFIEDGCLHTLHEVSEFLHEAGRWFYVDGEQVPKAPEKLARNSMCPCKSGKKYKQCHGKA